MIAYILLILLSILTIYLYSKNKNCSSSVCINCKGCDRWKEY